MNAALAELPDPPDPPRSRYECECGRRKSGEAKACPRCTYLDGGSAKQQLVIAALRGTDGMSLRELCLALYGQNGPNEARGMLKTVQTLARDRRIRRYWREDATHTTGARKMWGIREVALAGGGCWVYTLHGRSL